MARLTVHTDAEEAALDAARRIERAARAAQAARGRAHVSLAGGSTPRRTYELLGPMLVDPGAVHWWFGDERVVPHDHEDSNYRLVADSLLAGAAISDELVHGVPTELGAHDAASAYARELLREIAGNGPGVPVLDLALLGMGEDGHTASLFPGDPALQITDRLCVPVRAPKPPSDRITMTLPVLRAARRAIILATGPGKAEALRAVLAGPDPAVPAGLIGNAELIVDAAAAQLVSA